ncbi:MAG: sigma-54 dependent transcriptional regulator [Nitrososphaerales archaeon]
MVTETDNRMNPENLSVLVVDDDANITNLFRDYLKESGYRVFAALTSEKAEEIFLEEDIDCVLLDINMPRVSGLKLLESFRESSPEVIIIMVSGIHDIDIVVKCIQMGAHDYLPKPINDLREIGIRLERAFSERRMEQENQALRKELAIGETFPGIISESVAMQKVLDMIRAVSEYDTTVLLTGESGTGKELAARMIHKLSSRAPNPFVAVNCGSIPASLLESTLFGYEKGAFTGASRRNKGLFEQSNHGTILLDEITETTSEFQVQLLRVIETNEIRRIGGNRDIELNLRIVAATNRNIGNLVDQSEFRRDLYYRLNVFHIDIPALRHRREDIAGISDYEMKRLSKKFGKGKLHLSPEVLEMFEKNEWKGNIRELTNVIERALIMSTGDVITPEDLSSAFHTGRLVRSRTVNDEKTYYRARDNFEFTYFSDLLRQTEGNVTEAAARAGVSRQYLHSKIRKLSIK